MYRSIDYSPKAYTLYRGTRSNGFIGGGWISSGSAYWRALPTNSLENALLSQAFELGVDVRFGDRATSIDPGTETILAIGPRAAGAIVAGDTFDTHMADGNWIALSDSPAPLGYAYLLIVNGRGMVQLHVHGLQAPCPPLRYASCSGVLAARSLLEGRSYVRLWRTEVMPLVRTGVVNRFNFNNAGQRGRWWMLQRLGNIDARDALCRLYGPSVMQRLLYPLALWWCRSLLNDSNCDHYVCVWCELGVLGHDQGAGG